MVLQELGQKIRDALNKLNKNDEIDQKIFNEMVNAIALALIKSDVNIQLVKKLQTNIRNRFDEIEEEGGNKKLQIQRSVVKELQNMLTSKKQPRKMLRGKQNVIMFVGLQGSGKTTTCTKYANFYQKKGFKVALVCADTFRAGAIIFVMDSHIGQACHDQALAFKNAVDIGSVIITKLDGHAKGGGALSAVADTESPIIFIGTGEHFGDFEQFNPEGFIKRLLGMGDIKGLFEKIQEVYKKEDQEKLAKNISKGIFTIRDMRDQYTTVMKMGPLDKVINMIPGMSNIMPEGSEKEASKKMKKYLCIIDSMTDEELDCKKKIDESRIKRIARGSGSTILEVKIMMEEYKRFSKVIGRMGKLMKGKAGELTQMQRNPNQVLNKIGNILPQGLLDQMGGTGNLMNMMQQFSKMEGIDGLGGIKKKGKR